jgi:hypothetical protein
MVCRGPLVPGVHRYEGVVMSIPEEGRSAMATATAAATAYGHTPRVTAWRKLSRRMFATTCQDCGKTLWIAKQPDRWRMGGSATFESCTG